jgi:hypothetical protein
VGEVAAFEQERLAGCRCEGVGAAVAEVECSAMISLAVAAVGMPRQFQLACIERNDVDPAPMQKEVELASGRRAFPRFTTMLVSNTETTDTMRVGLASMTAAKKSSSASPKRMARAAELSVTMAFSSAWQPDLIVSENLFQTTRVEIGERRASPANRQQLVANPRRPALSFLTCELLAQRGRNGLGD